MGLIIFELVVFATVVGVAVFLFVDERRNKAARLEQEQSGEQIEKDRSK
jgi:hypothetical protein